MAAARIVVLFKDQREKHRRRHPRQEQGDFHPACLAEN